MRNYTFNPLAKSNALAKSAVAILPGVKLTEAKIRARSAVVRPAAMGLAVAILALLISSCTNNPYYEIPTDSDGNPLLTEVSSVVSSGITTADDSFSVTATLPNARPDDVMVVELLKPQPHEASESDQLLPLEGTRKEAIVDSNLQATVTYTREEADMNQAGDYVEVIFAGATDSAQLRVTMEETD